MIAKMYCDKFSISLSLTSKITILQGDSATGKSTIVMSISGNLKYMNIEVSNDYRVYKMIEEQDTLFWQPIPKQFVVIEETVTITDELAEKIRRASDCMFLIISRVPIRNLDYSLDDVNELYQCEDNVIRNRKVSINSIYDRHVSSRDSSVVLTDRTGAVQSWLKDLFKNRRCFTAYDTSRVAEVARARIEKLHYSGIILLVDISRLGAYSNEIITLFNDFGSKVRIVDNYVSWEYMMYTSNMFKPFNRDRYNYLYTGTEFDYYKELFTKFCKDYLCLEITDETEELPVCFSDGCCKREDYVYDCACSLPGRDKYVSMLKGTEFEVLLVLAQRGVR